MKIGYVANARIPSSRAHGVQIMKTCEALANADQDVTLILPRRAKCEPDIEDQNPFDYYKITTKFPIKKVFVLDFMPLLKSHPFTFMLLEYTFALRLLIYFRLNKFDIIYTRDEYVASILSTFHKNVVFEAHFYPNNFDLWKNFFKRCKKIVTINHRLKELFIGTGQVSSDKIIVAQDATSVDKVGQTKTGKGKVAVYTGHLFPEKGVDTIFETAKCMPDWTFCFVGGTEKDVQACKKKCEGLNNVYFRGHIPQPEVCEHLKMADVLIIPNSAKYKISSEYTSPMKLFEYMIACRPIMASRVPAIEEILDVHSCYYFTPDSSASLAASIREFEKDVYWQDKVNRAFGMVLDNTWDKRAEKILAGITFAQTG